jgi:serine/threonine protein kinase
MNGILHRDIKPENIVLSKNGTYLSSRIFILHLGYLRITDLGIARVWRENNAKDTSGTPGYMGKDFGFA